MKSTLLFLALLFLTSATQAQDSRLLKGFGVYLNLSAITPTLLDDVKKAGFDTIRLGISWPTVEKTKGVYTWDQYDTAIAQIKKKGFNLVLSLEHSNRLYAEVIQAPENLFGLKNTEAAPTTNEAQAAFTIFAREAVKRYNAKGMIWSIWNEPDTDIFWPPEPDVDAYIQLFEKTCRSIKVAVPQAIVAGSELAKLPKSLRRHTRFITAFIRSPAFDCLDALSVHPYQDGDWPPENSAAAYKSLRTILDQEAPHHKKNVPILSTEWGYSTTWATPEQHAAYALRAHILNRLHDVPVSIWYEWKSQGHDPQNPEDQFGFLDANGPKKSLGLLLAATSPLKNVILERQLPTPDESIMAVLLRDKNGQHSVLAWDITRKIKDKQEIILIDNHKTIPVRLSAMPQLIPVATPNPKIYSH
ncbi:MAG: cellulase family glycosylhydrolase [Alphaproteobacteria bacterium]|nr:cellulase family glycosylhydrolase [Alphaproteobacteria bacterium]